LLIRTARSLVSVGTAPMLVEFGKANLTNKASQLSDKVRQVLAKARTDGFVRTLEAVRNKLDQPRSGTATSAGRSRRSQGPPHLFFGTWSPRTGSIRDG
jgi:hypothetical protein